MKQETCILSRRMDAFEFSKHLSLTVILVLIRAGVADEGGGFHGEERNALLALKDGFKNSFLDKNWTSIMCYMNSSPRWYGIQCSEGRVKGILLENMGLSGKIRDDVLANLTKLSILSFRNNSISGNVLNFAKNQKLIWIDLSGNNFVGPISPSLLTLNSLESLRLQENKLNGAVPEFNQSTLREFNVSYNNLSGCIPNTTVLQSFDKSSYAGNEDLCGPPSSNPCPTKNDASQYKNDTSQDNNSSDSKGLGFAIILLIVVIVGLVVVVFLFIVYFKKYAKLKKEMRQENLVQRDEEREQKTLEERGKEGVVVEEKGKLIFMDSEEHFQLADLLKASAEGLGKGNFGNCYKAMMEDRPVIVVKRLRDLRPLSSEEFVKQTLSTADLKHPNLLPLLAYYNSEDEKFFVYKFAAYGNLYDHLHGRKGTKDRIPFRWSSRLTVARGVASALEYLHINPKSQAFVVPHGNLKSSNVLLDENEAVLVSDYGLTSLIADPIATQRLASFRSPEYLTQKKISKKSDVWSFGCLLLELLTGRIPSHSAPQGINGVDLCSWAHRAVREEWTAEVFDVEIAANRTACSSMLRLLRVALRCCDKSPEKRPEMSEVVKEIENVKVGVDSEDEDDLYSLDRSLTDDSASVEMIDERL